MKGIITIVLAAGKGERIGGPKALLAWPGATKEAPERPLAIAHAEMRLAAESSRVLVVARSAVIPSLLGYVRPGIDLVSSAVAEDLGPAGTLSVAAARLGDATAVIVTPVDVPPARAETVARLLALVLGEWPPSTSNRPPTEPLLAARPRFKGRGGHPVVLGVAALQRYLQPDPPPLRDYLQSLGDRCGEVDIDDPAVLLDLNMPIDVAGLLGGPPRFMS